MKHRHPAGSKWQANATSMSPTPIHLPFPGAARELNLRKTLRMPSRIATRA
ncbi:hypothetical protein HOY82DRAFT_485887 [Tuber indicum]|nr:hypothetical protein HOY82DRAFT_485887 [Tuber indicum]